MQTMEATGLVDRTGWTAGPWDNEPDKIQWRQPETAYPCLMLRSNVSGSWCGYVGVPPGHRVYGQLFASTHRLEASTIDAIMAKEVTRDIFLPLRRHMLTRGPSDGYDRINRYVSVHGGLTYSGDDRDSVDEDHPWFLDREPGDFKKLRWLGFDTAHAWDQNPGLDALTARYNPGNDLRTMRDNTYRTQQFVAAEVNQLAWQLHQLNEIPHKQWKATY